MNHNHKTTLSYMFLCQRNNSFLYSTSSSSSSHQSSMFSIGRLRLALCFICILAITTSLYCLVSYKPDGLKSSTFVVNSHHHPKSILLTSKTQILNEVICNANKYYLDYFRYKKITSNTTLVPAALSSSFSPFFHQDELSKLIYIIDNLTKSNREENFDLNLNSFNNLNRSKFLQERDILEYFDSYNLDDDPFDEDPNSVEYHLLHLGFDLKHIIYLYALNHPEKVSLINDSFKLQTTTNSKARYHQHYTQMSSSLSLQQQLNLSALLPEEFLTSIIFITTINSNQFHLAKGFIKSFENFRLWAFLNPKTTKVTKTNHIHVPKKKNFVLMIYDLGLYPEQLGEIEKLCNKTSNEITYSKLCEIRTFQYDIYPSHVSDLRMAAYRSIILQEMLRDIKFTIQYRDYFYKKKINPENVVNNETTLFWLDPQYRFINSKHHMVWQLQNETLHQSGILSWPIEQPTSALTHPRMFEYFHTTKENFYFHRMIQPGHLMIVISEKTWEPFQWGIMLPWVRCALTSNCIAPLGSQWRSTCRMDKKPHYRYSGCHHYDMSALNVVLGIAFNYSSSQYSAHLSRRFFSPFNEPLLSTTVDENDIASDSLFEYQFEYEDQSKVPGRFDLVLNDDDISSNELESSSKTNFLFSSFTSSPLLTTSSASHHH